MYQSAVAQINGDQLVPVVTSDDGRPLHVDRCQALPEPVPDRVLMNAEKARNLFHRIAAVDSGAAGIGMTCSAVGSR